MIIESAHSPRVGRPGIHSEINYDIHTMIDPLKVSIVLSKMVDKAGLDQKMANIFEVQANALLAAICSENNRLEMERRSAERDG